MADALTKTEIRQYLSEYFKIDSRAPGKNYDPVDDFARLCSLAMELPGVRNLPGYVDIDGPPIPPKGTARGQAIIQFVAQYLHALNPFFSEYAWSQLYHAILLERHGRGNLVRIRKRPALAAQYDARLPNMTPKKLQALHPHLCRSRIYKIMKETRAKK